MTISTIIQGPPRHVVEEVHMTAIDRYDIVVVGSGEAGKYLAWTLSKAGNRTALIERRMVGGSRVRARSRFAGDEYAGRSAAATEDGRRYHQGPSGGVR